MKPRENLEKELEFVFRKGPMPGMKKPTSGWKWALSDGDRFRLRVRFFHFHVVLRSPVG